MGFHDPPYTPVILTERTKHTPVILSERSESKDLHLLFVRLQKPLPVRKKRQGTTSVVP